MSKEKITQNPVGLTFSAVKIDGATVRSATVDGKDFFSLMDIVRLMGYRQIKSARVTVMRTIMRKGRDVSSEICNLQWSSGRKPKTEFISIAGLQVICDTSMPNKVSFLKSWLAKLQESDKKTISSDEESAKVFQAMIGDRLCRVGFVNGKVYVSRSDIESLCGYAQSSIKLKLTQFVRDSGSTLQVNALTLRFKDRRPPVFIRADGIEIICRVITPAVRTKVLRGWLDEYGTWTGSANDLIQRMNGTDVVDAQIVTTDVKSMPAPTAIPPATLARVETSAEPDTYCQALYAVIARHATQKELEELETCLESLSKSILQNRFAPEINDAVYRLRARFKTPTLPGLTEVKS